MAKERRICNTGLETLQMFITSVFFPAFVPAINKFSDALHKPCNGCKTCGISFTYLKSYTEVILSSGAPNDQFVEKCIIPQIMKIYVIKAFSGAFQYCWVKIICSFFPARHTRNFPAKKIKLVSFPASCKVSSQQAKERQFSTSYVKMGVAKGLKSTLQCGGGGGERGEEGITLLTKFHHQAMLEMPENTINSKTNSSAVTNSQLAHRNTYYFASQQDSSGKQVK